MTYNKKSVEDIDVSGKKVLVRCDFNVPMKDGKITDETRINGALPTIKYLLSKNAAVILCSHMGRPKGEFNPAFSLAPVAKRLSELLGQEVVLAADVIGEDAKAKAAALKPGEVMMIENVRFHKEEEKNDPAFAKELASMAEIYVNDAFGTAHRAHASTAGVADYLPAVCGYLIQKEISVMGKALSDPARPFTAILGGAKVSDKIGVINNLIDKVDTLIIGGGMAYTFMRALGNTTGTSICEEDKLELASDLMKKARAKGVSFLIPVDNIVAREYKEDADFMRIYSDAIPDGWMGLDIGPTTQELFTKTIAGSGTVIWNGPMGVSEWENFAAGTRAVAKAVAECGGISIIGTSGIVRPFSNDAFLASIRKEAEVAKAIGCSRLVINSGAKSERFLKGYLSERLSEELPPQMFVHYGNFIGKTLKIAAELQFDEVVMGIMIGKAVKLAEGALDTHSKKVVMNKAFLKELAAKAGCKPESVQKIDSLTLARELWELFSKTEQQSFFPLLLQKCREHCTPLLPNGKLSVLLISESGKITFQA